VVKSEGRIPKTEGNPKFQARKHDVANWEIWGFGIRSDFDLRISDF
jgi:hypothetical protein